MTEEQILALIAAPFMAAAIHRRTLQGGAWSERLNTHYRQDALYQARELLEHCHLAIHGPDNDLVPE